MKVTRKTHKLFGNIGILKCFMGHVDELQLYKYLMTIPYETVRQVGCWRVLRVLHRLIMAGLVTTEALAEMACSFCSIHERGLNGRKPALGDVLNAVKLRAAGVTGVSGNNAFIKRALYIHFQGSKW